MNYFEFHKQAIQDVRKFNYNSYARENEIDINFAIGLEYLSYRLEQTLKNMLPNILKSQTDQSVAPKQSTTTNKKRKQ